MGLSFVELEHDLPGAVLGALSFSGAAVLERKIVGTEVAVSMVEPSDDPLPFVEIVPKSGVFDYASRYTAGATEYLAPARVPSHVAAACRREASRAFETLGLRDVGRADVMIDSDGLPWLVDVNVSPAMTDTSLLPMAAHAAGIDLPELCDRIIRLALQRSSATES